MYTVSRILLILALTSLFRIDAANAQAIPKSIQQGGSDAAIKMRKNAWTVGLAGGLIDGTYMRFADELAKVLDDGDNLRILPMVSYGAATNLDDLLYLRGIDLAVTQSDVFEYFRTERKTPNLQNRVHYILRLPIAELHVLAKTDIRSLEDLAGRKWIQSDRNDRIPASRCSSRSGFDRSAKRSPEIPKWRSCGIGARRRK